MKPSEYINTILRYPMFTQKEYLKNIKDYDINLKKMDKQFIDKEEFKGKINKQIKEVEKVRDYPYSYKFLDTNQKKNLELECKYKIEAKKEILELIK